MQKIKVGSLFDGIGGWLLAATHSGAVPTFSCEIDPFPASVSHAHFPDVIQYGDVTKVKGDEIEPVDIICAGSPCQDLSIAGERKGLGGNRSSLFYEALRIVREMREKTNGAYPKFFIWENVTGAFSSNGRRDFQAVLEEIGQTDIPMPKSGRWAKSGMVRSKKCGIAWRTLDAQFWGVPQHRERIFLIAGFGRWGGYVKVLFERESVSRNLSEGKKEEKASSPETGISVNQTKPLVYCQRAYDQYDESETGSGLRASGGIYGGGSENIVIDNRIVRRLTPRECERLQGLPDDYTAYGSDGKRYKALGNGMAQPCADYVMGQVVKAIMRGLENANVSD